MYITTPSQMCVYLLFANGLCLLRVLDAFLIYVITCSLYIYVCSVYVYVCFSNVCLFAACAYIFVLFVFMCVSETCVYLLVANDLCPVSFLPSALFPSSKGW